LITIKAYRHRRGNRINKVSAQLPIFTSKAVNEASEIARKMLIVEAPYRQYGTVKSQKPRGHKMHIRDYLQNRALCSRKIRTTETIEGAIIFNDKLVPQARWVTKGTELKEKRATRGRPFSFWWARKGVWRRTYVVRQGIENPNNFISRAYRKSKLEIIYTFKKNIKSVGLM